MDVTLRLKHKADTAKEQVEAQKSAIIKFYLTNLISSKQAVPTRCAVCAEYKFLSSESRSIKDQILTVYDLLGIGGI